MIRRRSLLLGALALPMLGAADGESPLKVGVLTELTGPLAAQGKRKLLGAKYRAGGDMHGSDMMLIERDTAISPQDAVFSLLEEGVHALIALTSAPSLVDAANSSCTPMLTTGSASGDFAFQAGPSPQQIAAAMMRQLSSKGLKAPGLMSLGPADPSFAEEAANRGLTVPGAESFDTKATDLSAVAASLIAKKPDAIVVSAPAPFDAYAVRDARAAGWTGPIFTGPESVRPDFAGVAGQGVQGVMAVSPWAGSPAPPDDLPNATVIRRFKDGFTPDNGLPGIAEAIAADAVSLLRLAFLGHRDRKEAKAQLDKMCAVGVCGLYNPKLGGDALTTLTSKNGSWANT